MTRTASTPGMGCINCNAPLRRGSCSNSKCPMFPGNCTHCEVCHGVRFKGRCTFERCASNGGPIDYRRRPRR